VGSNSLAGAAKQDMHDGLSTFVEPSKWPLLDIEEVVKPCTRPNYMLRHVRGIGSAALQKATSESNAERERMIACPLV